MAKNQIFLKIFLDNNGLSIIFQAAAKLNVDRNTEGARIQEAQMHNKPFLSEISAESRTSRRFSLHYCMQCLQPIQSIERVCMVCSTDFLFSTRRWVECALLSIALKDTEIKRDSMEEPILYLPGPPQKSTEPIISVVPIAAKLMAVNITTLLKIAKEVCSEIDPNTKTISNASVNETMTKRDLLHKRTHSFDEFDSRFTNNRPINSTHDYFRKLSFASANDSIIEMDETNSKDNENGSNNISSRYLVEWVCEIIELLTRGLDWEKKNVMDSNTTVDGFKMSTHQMKVFESEHHCEAPEEISGQLSFPGAGAIHIDFDVRCSIKEGSGWLQFFHDEKRTCPIQGVLLTGVGPWSPMDILGDQCFFTYMTDSGQSDYYGFRFVAYPIFVTLTDDPGYTRKIFAKHGAVGILLNILNHFGISTRVRTTAALALAQICCPEGKVPTSIDLNCTCKSDKTEYGLSQSQEAKIIPQSMDTTVKHESLNENMIDSEDCFLDWSDEQVVMYLQQELLQEGIDALLDIIEVTDPILQEHSVRLLSRLSGMDQVRHRMVERGHLRLILRLLETGELNSQLVAARVLADIAGSVAWERSASLRRIELKLSHAMLVDQGKSIPVNITQESESGCGVLPECLEIVLDEEVCNLENGNLIIGETEEMVARQQSNDSCFVISGAALEHRKRAKQNHQVLNEMSQLSEKQQTQQEDSKETLQNHTLDLAHALEELNILNQDNQSNPSNEGKRNLEYVQENTAENARILWEQIAEEAEAEFDDAEVEEVEEVELNDTGIDVHIDNEKQIEKTSNEKIALAGVTLDVHSTQVYVIKERNFWFRYSHTSQNSSNHSDTDDRFSDIGSTAADSTVAITMYVGAFHDCSNPRARGVGFHVLQSIVQTLLKYVGPHVGIDPQYWSKGVKGPSKSKAEYKNTNNIHALSASVDATNVESTRSTRGNAHFDNAVLSAKRTRNENRQSTPISIFSADNFISPLKPSKFTGRDNSTTEELAQFNFKELTEEQEELVVHLIDTLANLASRRIDYRELIVGSIALSLLVRSHMLSTSRRIRLFAGKALEKIVCDTRAFAAVSTTVLAKWRMSRDSLMILDHSTTETIDTWSRHQHSQVGWASFDHTRSPSDSFIGLDPLFTANTVGFREHAIAEALFGPDPLVLEWLSFSAFRLVYDPFTSWNWNRKEVSSPGFDGSTPMKSISQISGHVAVDDALSLRISFDPRSQVGDHELVLYRDPDRREPIPMIHSSKTENNELQEKTIEKEKDQETIELVRLVGDLSKLEAQYLQFTNQIWYDFPVHSESNVSGDYFSQNVFSSKFPHRFQDNASLVIGFRMIIDTESPLDEWIETSEHWEKFCSENTDKEKYFTAKFASHLVIRFKPQSQWAIKQPTRNNTLNRSFSSSNLHSLTHYDPTAIVFEFISHENSVNNPEVISISPEEVDPNAMIVIPSNSFSYRVSVESYNLNHNNTFLGQFKFFFFFTIQQFVKRLIIHYYREKKCF